MIVATSTRTLDNGGVRTNAKGLALIQAREGCRLTAYQDGAGIWTIGWGHTAGVYEGMTITQERADELFLGDVSTIEFILGRVLGTADSLLNTNQFSALVSFCFNVGFGRKGVKDGFQTLKTGEPSTMLCCLRADNYVGAAAEFPKWDKVAGVVSAGILERRKLEQALFLEESGDGTA